MTESPYEAALRMRGEGKTPAEVEGHLRGQGMDDTSIGVVMRAVRMPRDPARVPAPLPDDAGAVSTPRGTPSGFSLSGESLYGLLIMAVGIAVTVGTHQLAEANGGGTYVVAWGAILFGGIRFIRGLGR